MPINNIVDLQIQIAPPPLALEGFGIPIEAVILTPAQEALWGSDRVKSTTPAGLPQFLTDNGITASEDAALALNALAGQSGTIGAVGAPEVILVGRRLAAVAQVNTYVVVGNTDGTYEISINGNDASFAAVSQTITQIRDALETALGLLGEPVTVAAVSTDTITVTANFAGQPFTSSVSSPVSGELTEAVTTPSHGLPEDVAEFRLERDDFYLVEETTRATGNIVPTATANEVIRASKPQMFGYQTSDAAVETVATTDVMSQLQALNIEGTWGVIDPDDDQFIDAAWAGKQLPTDPGSTTWNAQDLALVTGRKVSQDVAALIEGKNGNWLESFTAGSFTMTQGDGKVANGQFIDLVRGRDFAVALIQLRLTDLIRVSPKLPYTDDGLALIGANVRASLLELAAIGLVVASSIDVDVPVKSLQTPANITARIVDNVTFTAVLQGAVHKITVRGTLIP